MDRFLILLIVVFGLSVTSVSQNPQNIPVIAGAIEKLEQRNKTIDSEIEKIKFKKTESELNQLKSEKTEREAIAQQNTKAQQLAKEAQKTWKQAYDKYVLNENKLIKEKNNNSTTINQLYRLSNNIPSHKKHLVAGISTSCSGNTIIKHTDGTQSKCSKEVIALMKGDIIETSDNSRNQMYLFDEALRLDVEDAAIISMQEETVGDITIECLKLFEGKIYNKIYNKLRKKFEVRGPAWAMAVRGTEYEINVNKDGETIVHLFEGEVEIDNTITKEKTSLKPGQKITITKDGKSTGPVEFDNKEIKQWWED